MTLFHAKVTKVMGVPGLKAAMDATGQLYGGNLLFVRS